MSSLMSSWVSTLVSSPISLRDEFGMCFPVRSATIFLVGELPNELPDVTPREFPSEFLDEFPSEFFDKLADELPGEFPNA